MRKRISNATSYAQNVSEVLDIGQGQMKAPANAMTRLRPIEPPYSRYDIKVEQILTMIGDRLTNKGIDIPGSIPLFLGRYVSPILDPNTWAPRYNYLAFTDTLWTPIGMIDMEAAQDLKALHGIDAYDIILNSELIQKEGFSLNLRREEILAPDPAKIQEAIEAWRSQVGL